MVTGEGPAQGAVEAAAEGTAADALEADADGMAEAAAPAVVARQLLAPRQQGHVGLTAASTPTFFR